MANTEKKPSLVSKYVWVISTIYHHRRLTFNELNELWVEYTDLSFGEDLPKRTFDNWRAVIADMFGIDIENEKQGRYRYYIENEQDIAGDGLRSWIYNTQCLSNTISSNLNLKDRILLEYVPSGQQYLQPIIDAMKNGRVITITYRSYWKTEAHTFDLEPYCVKLFKQRWYVVAHNPHPDYCNGERIYALDRILQLSVKEERFEFPKNWSGEEFFADCFGIFPGEDTPVETVKLKVSSREANYLRSLPLHHSQKEEQRAEDYSVFSYLLRPTFDFKQEILRLGDQAVVLEPAALREEIKNTLTRALSQY